MLLLLFVVPQDSSVCAMSSLGCYKLLVLHHKSHDVLCCFCSACIRRCCLRRTCADTDPTTAALDPQACPAGSILDSSKSTFSPPSAEQCCKRVIVPSCNDTQPDVFGCQPYVCDASKGLVFRTNATDINPSDSVCCLVSLEFMSSSQS
jgi:hypothetical protein